MIDYIKAKVIGINNSQLENNQKLNFCYEVNPQTGEVRKPYKNALYNGLDFRIYDSGSIYVSGSIHKYWNHGSHNFNDFNIDSIITVLNELKQRFDIAPHQMKLRQIEIGVNFIPPKPTKELLRYCFLHRTTPYEMKYNSDEGKYIQFEHSQYIIKIYDKARHYRKKGLEVPEPEIMRFEIKYKKLEKLKKLSIYTLQDLINYGLHNFIDVLITEWENILFYDATINHKSKSLDNYKNPLYWYELKNRTSSYYKNKRKFQEIVKTHSEDISSQIKNCIRNKGLFLTKEGTSFDQKSYECNALKKDTKGTSIDLLYIKSNPVPLKNQKKFICPITGLDVSMQKESFYLSHTGLKYYYQTDRKIYNQVKRLYLSKEWINSEHKTQVKEIAHNIRNKANNLKIKQKRIYPDDQYRLTIFD